jgi:NAD(P)-dependent dehydrogenase (short-subunit alcohol dehydrogenase family)
MLSNKNILITGASSGIGRQIAIDCAQNGGIIILCARRTSELIEVQNSLTNPEVHKVINCDLTIDDQLNHLVESLPYLDGVVFNAGIVAYRPIALINQESIRNIFSINFEVNVILLQKLLKNKKLNNGASIVFIGSISSHLGNPGTALYAASKAAISAYSKVVASELAKKQIRSNVISPGLIYNENYKNASGPKGEKISIEESYPLGLGLCSDISNQVVFLLSNKSRWITGTDIIIDGGYSLSKEI